MFKCQNCQTIVPAHTKAQRVTIEKRQKTYAITRVVKRLKGIYLTRHDKGGEGWEIAREIVVCPDCAAKLK